MRDVMELQLLNAERYNSVRVDGKVTPSRLLQFAKAPLYMLVTPSGITIVSVNPLQWSKALFPMVLKLEGKSGVFRLWQL